MSQLSLVLQETVRGGREARTILEVLRDQMDDGDAARGGRRSFKQRLRFNGIGCCGAAWGFGRTTTISVGDDEQLQQTQQQQQQQQQLPNLSQLLILGQANTPNSGDSDPDCLGPAHSGSGMNLAAALAAERHFREAVEAAAAAGPTAPGTPMRVSLMRLLEETETETEGCDDGAENNNEKAACDSVCCVCMGRKKGAAFIPCGHTFCRVCSREVWLNRGSCPLCNRTILEILDIF